MKRLLVIFFLALYVLFPVPVRADETVRQELVTLARKIEVRNAEIRAERQFNTLVQNEAKRLGVGPEKYPVIGDIIRTFGSDYRVALAVARAESGLRCEAYHFNQDRARSVDHSVFQLNDVHSWRGNLNDCHQNVIIAKEIHDESGWWPWVVYQRGIYKAYL